jgi:hypothetical protein
MGSPFRRRNVAVPLFILVGRSRDGGIPKRMGLQKRSGNFCIASPSPPGISALACSKVSGGFDMAARNFAK